MPPLTLYDFRDLDLMHLALENADELGNVTTEELAAALGFGEDLRNVGARLGAMRRMGIFNRNEKKDLKPWHLTRAGERILAANELSLSEGIDEIPDGQLVTVMSRVMTRYRGGDPLTAQMMRREFLFGTRQRTIFGAGRRR